MTNIEPIDITDVQAHEEATASNVRIGGYDMPVPLYEVRCYRAVLEASDIDRLFLLGIGDFGVRTSNTWQVSKTMPSVRALKRVDSLMRNQVDLRCRPELSPVVVTVELVTKPLVIIDGNHRTIAQFLSFGTVGFLPVYACVHPGFAKWSYMPRLARESIDEL